MPFDPDDFRLTAYALGELDAADREAIESILHDDPDCRAFVAGIEETARLLSEELRHETTATFGLGPVRREAIEDRLATPATLSITPSRPSRLLGRVLLALAASVIGFVVGIFFQK